MISILYAKVFTQIYDSSIAEDFITRLVFMDFLVLSDINGVVDMTHEAIARRTNVPLDHVRKAITHLESPDPKSRTPAENGARIVRLDKHRDWGWIIVNYEVFRRIASEEQRREKTKERVKRYRSNTVTLGNAVKRPRNAFPSPSTSTSPLQEGGPGETKPEWEFCQKWLVEAKKNGADYTERETRSAFLALSASGWMWGKNPVVDYRAALERQIQTDRARNKGNSKPGPGPVKEWVDANGVRRRLYPDGNL